MSTFDLFVRSFTMNEAQIKELRSRLLLLVQDELIVDAILLLVWEAVDRAIEAHRVPDVFATV
jgi:hypothetical protein